MSMDSIHSQSGVRPSQQSENTQGIQGQLGGHQVEVGNATPRATSAFKTVLLEIKHFFTSLFGIRVSPAKPDAINSVESGARAVISDLSRKKLDTGDAMVSLGALWDQCEFNQPENRNPDFTPKTDGVFRDQVGALNDMQLLRLHSNLGKHREFLDPLIQGGAGLVMEIEIPTREQMQSAGKVSDMGWLATALGNEVVTELRARGYEVPDLAARLTDGFTEDMELVAKRTIVNGGDVQRSVNELRQEANDATRRALGYPTQAEEAQIREQDRPKMTPEQLEIVNERLKASGLPQVGLK